MGITVNTTLLEEELAPLNAQIEETREKYEALATQLRLAEADLEKFSADRQRFDALEEVRKALVNLDELKAGELFWKGLPESVSTEEHLRRVRERIARFEDKISGILEEQASIQSRIDERLAELDELHELVRDAHEREERRKEEFVIEREISPVPFREMIMPWTKEAESEKRFRRAVLVALLVCVVFGAVFQLVTVPVTERQVDVVEIPKRLAKLVKDQRPKPAPPPRAVAKKVDEASQKPKAIPEEPPKKSKEATEPVPKKMARKSKASQTTKKQRAGGGPKGARKTAERVGVLAFKKSFAGLIDETPVAKLGTEARITKTSPRVAGQAVAQRSLVAMQAKGGTSGGRGLARVSRNVGSGSGNGLGGSGIGRSGSRGDGAGFADVESAIAGISESDRPLSDGPGPGRTDEEIQIVFDRYKATLYRIYNRELRKDPTLRGKILLRIRIETSGAVSLCKVESTDLASPELVAKIVARIGRFNFGFKKDVPALTILYPIDFLPAG